MWSYAQKILPATQNAGIFNPEEQREPTRLLDTIHQNIFPRIHKLTLQNLFRKHYSFVL